MRADELRPVPLFMLMLDVCELEFRRLCVLFSLVCLIHIEGLERLLSELLDCYLSA